jgi:hypothetical protein
MRAIEPIMTWPYSKLSSVGGGRSHNEKPDQAENMLSRWDDHLWYAPTAQSLYRTIADDGDPESRRSIGNSSGISCCAVSICLSEAMP